MLSESTWLLWGFAYGSDFKGQKTSHDASHTVLSSFSPELKIHADEYLSITAKKKQNCTQFETLSNFAVTKFARICAKICSNSCPNCTKCEPNLYRTRTKLASKVALKARFSHKICTNFFTKLAENFHYNSSKNFRLWGFW